ncbi:MAG: hypothetical protein ABIO51_05495, partial [Solirubrobacteraceae bacterium]
MLAGAAGGAMAARLGPRAPDAFPFSGAALAEPSAYSGALVGEVITGGTGASDEFVEIYNASAALVDMNGLEVVYVTSSGST